MRPSVRLGNGRSCARVWAEWHRPAAALPKHGMLKPDHVPLHSSKRHRGASNYAPNLCMCRLWPVRNWTVTYPRVVQRRISVCLTQALFV